MGANHAGAGVLPMDIALEWEWDNNKVAFDNTRRNV